MSNNFSHVYPFADRLIGTHKLIKKPFLNLKPSGIVIHHAADRDARRVRVSLEQKGYGYHIIIARDGMTEQHAIMSHSVAHAGFSSWYEFNPNTDFIGVCLLSWGEVKKIPKSENFVTWNNLMLEKNEVAYRKSNINNNFYFWDKATDEQMASLNRFCLWAMKEGIPSKNIVGHDEVALPLGRKSDPGGVLPMTMKEYRSFIQTDYDKITGAISNDD